MRRLITFIGTLVILGVLAVVGDRAAAGYAADRVERELAAEGFQNPEVAIGGFPFLTQFVDGEYREVTVHASALQVEAGRVDNVAATLMGMRVDNYRDPGSVRARELQARATVPYPEVERAAEIPSLRIRRGRGGEVALSGEIELLDNSFAVAARGRIEAKGDRLLVIPTGFEVEGFGELDERLSSLLADQFTLNYPIEGLPRGVRVRSITPGATGFVVEVTGRDAVLRVPDPTE